MLPLYSKARRADRLAAGLVILVSRVENAGIRLHAAGWPHSWTNEANGLATLWASAALPSASSRWYGCAAAVRAGGVRGHAAMYAAVGFIFRSQTVAAGLRALLPQQNPFGGVMTTFADRRI